jgi:hypothetical protein
MKRNFVWFLRKVTIIARNIVVFFLCLIFILFFVCVCVDFEITQCVILVRKENSILMFFFFFLKVLSNIHIKGFFS